ncbi:MAG: hypothetical protein MUC72_07865 [Acidobacteria bacterium]|jgi:hypothetical protein|nr:hypothetical protein [Acidobacteriota bacterium]
MRPHSAAAALALALLALAGAACSDAGGPEKEPARVFVFAIGAGAVERSPGGEGRPGEALTLTAVPADGWRFERWSGSLSATANPLTFTLGMKQTCIAVFRPIDNGSQYVPGASHFGRNRYTEYIPGDRPLVISVPHGGELKPAEIPDRVNGETTQDGFVIELGREVAGAYGASFQGRPHLVLCHLHREKLDANREPGEGAAGDPFALLAWNEFQEFILVAKATVERGLYLDLHGQSDDEARQQLGYLLSAQDLRSTDAELDQGALAAGSSIRHLAQASAVPFSRLLRGPGSLGGLLEKLGYEAVPSPQWPHPGAVPYYDGGYNTQVHGSRDGGTVDGIQLEATRKVRFDAVARGHFADALARALGEFVSTWY